tara:strand:+ start:12314 stop:12439 length:126 start_codon:yes stop_codon:yes gene_type:complete
MNLVLAYTFVRLPPVGDVSCMGTGAGFEYTVHEDEKIKLGI